MVMRCSNKLDREYFCDFIFLYTWFEKRNLSWDLSHPINILKNIVLWIFTHIFVSSNFMCLNFTLSIINDLSPVTRTLLSLITRVAARSSDYIIKNIILPNQTASPLRNHSDITSLVSIESHSTCHASCKIHEIVNPSLSDEIHRNSNITRIAML